MHLTENAVAALLLTVAAGLFTAVGSTIAFFIRKPRFSYLAVALGFSAGVMIYVSFMELIPICLRQVSEAATVAAFFAGIFIIGTIDFFIPESENPDHHGEMSLTAEDHNNPKLMRAGMVTALAVAIHNFPEGLATFGAALSDLKLGIYIAIAIAIHNIPEGIAVSMPIFYATKNKNKAFFYSAISGLSEPVGAMIGFLAILPFLSEKLIALQLSAIAGIMVYISVDELLPLAHNYGKSHQVIAGIVLGMLVMAASLLLL